MDELKDWSNRTQIYWSKLMNRWLTLMLQPEKRKKKLTSFLLGVFLSISGKTFGWVLLSSEEILSIDLFETTITTYQKLLTNKFLNISFLRVFTLFGKWILKVYGLTTKGANVKNYTSKVRLDYPLPDKVTLSSTKTLLGLRSSPNVQSFFNRSVGIES